MSLKDELIAAAEIPTGTSDFAGKEITIRGLTSAEEIKFSEKGFTENALAICAACIVEDGKSIFTEKELTETSGKIKAGIFKTVLLDVLSLSYPKDIEKN